MVTDINVGSIEEFQDRIMTWWSANARELPWRRNPSPYNVLVSEIMLQQTQVSRVVPKFHEFIQEFPMLKDLAEANTKRLLQVWSGLGYNRRAVWLREAAQSIIEQGYFPTSVEELRKLKGVGPYTSRSILIFAFNEDLAAVDTNIRRVFIGFDLADENMAERELQEVADKHLLRGHSRDWHNALMDYGSEVLTSSVTGISPRTQQSKFSGSIRQVRGQIIRLLTKSSSLSKEDIYSRIDPESMKNINVDQVLNNLVDEKLVEITESGKVRIAE